MKFACSVEINLPVSRVIEIFYNDDYLPEWQEGFLSKELLSGVKGEVGAKSRIIFHVRKQTMELTETILSKNLPVEMTSLFEHIHMTNTMRNCFIFVGESKTKIEIHIDYTKFNGFVPKAMSVLMPGLFKRQTQNMFDRFKVFAEKLK